MLELPSVRGLHTNLQKTKISPWWTSPPCSLHHTLSHGLETLFQKFCDRPSSTEGGLNIFNVSRWRILCSMAVQLRLNFSCYIKSLRMTTQFQCLFTCMILAGKTFSFIQESRSTYASRSLGTIWAFPLSLLEHSREYMSSMAFQPKLVPFSSTKLFAPPFWDKKGVDHILKLYRTVKY